MTDIRGRITLRRAVRRSWARPLCRCRAPANTLFRVRLAVPGGEGIAVPHSGGRRSVCLLEPGGEETGAVDLMRTNKGVSKQRSSSWSSPHTLTMKFWVAAGPSLNMGSVATSCTLLSWDGALRAAASRRPRRSEIFKEQAHRANTRLGVASVRHFDFPDNRMDGVERLDVTRVIESLIGEIGRAALYTHWAGDVNIDHRRVHDAAVTACRPQPGHCVEALLFFEVASSTEWRAGGPGAPSSRIGSSTYPPPWTTSLMHLRSMNQKCARFLIRAPCRP